MPPRSRPIRWSLLSAQDEFGFDRKTIKTRLSQAGQKPDSEGKYTTKQLVNALFTSREKERDRLTREQADKIALENALTRRELVPLETVERVWVSWLLNARDAVGNLDVANTAKQNILGVMRDIPLDAYFEEPAPVDL